MPAPARTSRVVHSQVEPGMYSPPGRRSRFPPGPAPWAGTARARSLTARVTAVWRLEGKLVPCAGCWRSTAPGDHLVGPGPVGYGLRHVRQRPCGAGGAAPGGHLQDAPVPGRDVDHGEHDDDDDARWQEQAGQRRQHGRGGRRDLVENPEQARVPADRSGGDQERRNAEEHGPETSQEPGGPGLGYPGRPVRPPPRSGPVHRDQAAGASARQARCHRLAAWPSRGRLGGYQYTTATSARTGSRGPASVMVGHGTAYAAVPGAARAGLPGDHSGR